MVADISVICHMSVFSHEEPSYILVEEEEEKEEETYLETDKTAQAFLKLYKKIF